VAIARAIVTEPTVLLADEPTGNLSREGGDEVLAIFEQLHADGVSVVLVTHDPRVGAFAERCVRLEDGRIISDEWVVERTMLEVA
jgi:putative ABC transport system ATP-binding protein